MKRDGKQRLSVIEMFDPLGQCELKPFARFLKQFDIMVMNRGYPVQFNDEELSNTCGMHCALVAQLLCDSNGKKTLNDVMPLIYRLGQSKDDVAYNECIALYYMLKRFTKHGRVFKKLRGCATTATK